MDNPHNMSVISHYADYFYSLELYKISSYCYRYCYRLHLLFILNLLPLSFLQAIYLYNCQ